MALAVPHCPFNHHNTNHTPAQTIQAIEIIAMIQAVVLDQHLVYLHWPLHSK